MKRRRSARIGFCGCKDFRKAQQGNDPDTLDCFAVKMAKIAFIAGGEMRAAATDCGAEDGPVFFSQGNRQEKLRIGYILYLRHQRGERVSLTRAFQSDVPPRFFSGTGAGDDRSTLHRQLDKPEGRAAMQAGGEQDIGVEKDFQGLFLSSNAPMAASSRVNSAMRVSL